MVSWPVRVPPTVGKKFTSTVQEPPGGICMVAGGPALGVQSSNHWKSPVTSVLVLWNTKGIVPVLVTVTGCAPPNAFTTWDPNVNEDGEMLIPAVTPVPVRLMI